MIRSMTAFARQELRADWGTLTWELRTVNHRYLEISTRLPEEFRVLEPEIREVVSTRLSRGKLECNLRFQQAPGVTPEVDVDQGLAQALVEANQLIEELLLNAAHINPMELLRWPGVLSLKGPDLEPVFDEAIQSLTSALEELITTREREGERINAVISQRCTAMRDLVEEAKQRLPEVLERQRQRLIERLIEIRDELKEDRLEQEMVMFAQKIDVAEELDRLETHIDEVERVLERDEAVGRRLDFLMQELNREANTLGSKSADIETTRIAVDLKVLIEQMREQVQNIE
ncbi:MAG: YicC family protein [Proteobacteria bacterium]|nr:MAG: YicC family protein [Pseudomonadota bacterium]QKK10891.1 MAG: YicC family protein [Pseudomonadota bacterium]